MAEQKAWLEISLECSGEIAEAVAEVFARYCPNGVVLNNLTRYDSLEHEEKTTGMMRVAGYLPHNQDLEKNRLALEEALWHMSQIAPLPNPTFTEIADQDWMALWKQHYQPLPIGNRWLILPAWLNPEEKEQRTIIRIDPAMAFGTGTHPSTQLCLLAMQPLLSKGQQVIDLGCGSGILAIGALKSGASYALALDTDEQAVLAAKNNAILNDVSEKIEVFQGSLAEILQSKYPLREAPLVLANILAPVLIQLLDQGLAETVSAGGFLVMAGILAHQAEDVLNACKNHDLILVRRYQQEDWVALVLKKSS